MTDAADIPEPDRVEGAPHPRETLHLLGHGAAEAEFLDAFVSGRLHHGWLIAGPRGVGKATLAWRIARFLLATPETTVVAGPSLFGDAPEPSVPASLDVDPEHPVARRMRAGAEPRLFVLRRAWDEDKKRLKTVITVDEVRKLGAFLHLSAADGGRRAVIVDTVDEMNASAANALLKLLEEPPAGVTLLLVSHHPSGILPTIRSRCRTLRLEPLAAGPLSEALAAAGAPAEDGPALGQLAAGSVGEAIRIANLDGLAHYADLVALFATLPRLDRPKAIALAEAATGRGTEGRADLMIRLVETFLSRLARHGATGVALPEAARGEAALIAQLAPDPWAARAWAGLHQTLSQRARHAMAVNLDPAALLLDMVLKVNETAAQLAAR